MDRKILIIPEGWAWISLEDALLKLTDGSHNPPERKADGIPMLSAQNIENNRITFENVRYISLKDFESECERTNIEVGDVLLTIVGSIGRAAFVSETIKTKFAIQRSVALLKPSSFLDGKYLMYLIQSPFFQKELNENAKGTAQKGVYLKTLKAFHIPITSLNEQRIIVSQIDSLFSKLEEAESGLKKAERELKIYSQSLLKKAFDGELTKNWRDNKSIDAYQELQCIQKKRKEYYNSELKNKTSKAPKADFNFVFKRDNNISTWAESTLDNLIDINARIGWKGLTKKEYTSEGALFLSVHSLNYGKNVVFKDANYISIGRYEESPEIQLKENDILLCKDGAGIGKLGIIKNLPDIATVNSSLLVINGREVFNSDFLYYFFLGPDMQRLVNEKISGSAIPHLFQKDIKKFSLKVPPILEQNEIVGILESRFTLADNIEKVIDNTLDNITVLKHSILKKAFEGKLVNNDTNESVVDLLKQIEKEKDAYLKSQRELVHSKPKQKKQMEEKKSILEILKESNTPITVQQLWESSTSEGDIERFYNEIKDIYDQIVEVKSETESLLSIKNENQ
ncbi:MAG: restriction endonuclease subunit S [Bacteroides graminisolvens]|uniref:restriction endonuclease subunit S n=1 Tax=Bacteroides graminisolvens TaxID=477666 RepID=UPI003A8497DE